MVANVDTYITFSDHNGSRWCMKFPRFFFFLSHFLWPIEATIIGLIFYKVLLATTFLILSEKE